MGITLSHRHKVILNYENRYGGPQCGNNDF
jgi:hypothetical protein